MISERYLKARGLILAKYGYSEETISSVPEELQSKIGSELMYELVHSPGAKLEQAENERQERFREFLTAEIHRVNATRKAEAILAEHRIKNREHNKKITSKKLQSMIREQSVNLYCKSFQLLARTIRLEGPQS